MVPFHELHDRFIEDPTLETSKDINWLVNTADALVVLQHPNFPNVYYTRLHLGMVWCIDVAAIVRNALEPQQSTLITQLTAGHGHPEVSPTARSPGPHSSSSSSSFPQQPAFTSAFRSSPQQKQKYPSGNAVVQSEMMNFNCSVKHTAGTLTFDGTPLKLKQIHSPSVSDATSKNTSQDDAIVSALTARVASQEPKEFPFFTDESRPHSAQSLNTRKPDNIQRAASEHAVAFDADIFNNFLPYDSTTTEPWESDLSDPMMLDGYNMSS